jgi:hypothetical protein
LKYQWQQIYCAFKSLYQRAGVANLKGLSVFRQYSLLGDGLAVEAPASTAVHGRGCAI